jgi:hypothetical protein
MSYDLFMFAPQEGEDPDDTLGRLSELEEEGAPEPEIIARNRRLMAALMALNPAFEKWESDDGSQFQLVDEQVSLEVELFHHQAAISFPYAEDVDAATVTKHIDAAAKVIAADTGWRLYDPQLEKFVDMETDRADITGGFDTTRDRFDQVLAEEHAPRKPFWRRLFGG